MPRFRLLQMRHAALLAAGLCLYSPICIAHGDIEGTGAFYGGLLHVLLVPSALLAVLAVGVFSGQRGFRFVAGSLPLLGGAVLLGLVLTGPDAEAVAGPVQLAAAALTGLLVALEVRMPNATATALVALSGGLIAYGSPADVGAGWLGLAGAGVGIALLFTWVAVPVCYLDRAWQRIGIRVIGSWLVASAALTLVLLYQDRAVG